MVRDIHIKPVLNGFLVAVGCQHIVIKSVDELADEVRKYYKAPETTEKTYVANAINRTMDCPNPVDPRAVDSQCAAEAPMTGERADRPRLNR